MNEMMSNDGQLSLTAIRKIKQILKLEEETKKLKAEMNEALYNEMENKGFLSFENEDIKITRVMPTKSNRVDSKKLKQEYPEAYADCMKETERKGYIKYTKR